MDDLKTIIKKSKDVKEYIKANNLNFNIPWNDLPEVPEDPSEEMLIFIIENFKLICLTDQRELLSYLMLVFSPESFTTLLALLVTEQEVDIDALMPIC